MADKFVKLSGEVLSRSDLSAGAKLVYAYILDCVGKNETAWPGLRTISKACGMTRNGSAKCVAALRDAKLIDIVCGKRGRSNVYKCPTKLDTSIANECPTELASGVQQSVPVCPTKCDTSVQQSWTEPDKTNEPDSLNQTKRTRRAAAEVVFPASLATDRFKAAWAEWEHYRKSKGSSLTSCTVTKQLKLLEAMGHDRAIGSIEQSITNGWQGLFEPRNDHRGSDPSRVPTPAGKYANLKIMRAAPKAQAGAGDPPGNPANP